MPLGGRLLLVSYDLRATANQGAGLPVPKACSCLCRLVGEALGGLAFPRQVRPCVVPAVNPRLPAAVTCLIHTHPPLAAFFALSYFLLLCQMLASPPKETTCS